MEEKEDLPAIISTKIETALQMMINDRVLVSPGVLYVSPPHHRLSATSDLFPPTSLPTPSPLMTTRAVSIDVYDDPVRSVVSHSPRSPTLKLYG